MWGEIQEISEISCRGDFIQLLSVSREENTKAIVMD